jgi:SPX domain protein involved in polyphosphate accumulation
MYRYEDKFRVSDANVKTLIAQLESIDAKVPYAPRVVNSIYFDTTNLDMYRESEEGTTPRMKLRLRWYGETTIRDSGVVQIERKYNSDNGRFKSSEVLNTNKLKNVLDRKTIFDSKYGILSPKVHVCYLRRYFTIERIRITIDTQIRYLALQSSTWTSRLVAHENYAVMELKYKSPEDMINLSIPLHENQVRFSKYCNALTQAIRQRENLWH